MLSFQKGLVLLVFASGWILSSCIQPAPSIPGAAENQPSGLNTLETENVQELTSRLVEAELDRAFEAFLGGMEGYGQVGLETLYQSMYEDQPFILDVRTEKEVLATGYIPGAVLIPLGELGENIDKLPGFDQKIVSYCVSGWRCTIAMTGLGALGWDIVSLKENSFSGWVARGYPIQSGIPGDAPVLAAAIPDPELLGVVNDMFLRIPETYGHISVEKLVQVINEKPDLVLMDTRTEQEINRSSFESPENTINIPLEKFIAYKALWPEDKDTPIAIFCSGGHRSTIAMTILWTYGYTDVVSLTGGVGF